MKEEERITTSFSEESKKECFSNIAEDWTNRLKTNEGKLKYIDSLMEKKMVFYGLTMECIESIFGKPNLYKGQFCLLRKSAEFGYFIEDINHSPSIPAWYIKISFKNGLVSFFSIQIMG